MDYKKIRKNIGYFTGWIGLNTSSLIIKFTPERHIYKIANLLTFLASIIARKHKRVALESLTIAFGREKTAGEIKQIAKDCFASIAKSAVEFLYFIEKPSRLKERISIVGEHYLKDSLAKGKGIILVTAHFGNFPLMLAKLCLEGYKTAGIMRPMRDHRAEKFFSKRRARFKLRTIHTQPRRACVQESILALRNNELLFIPIDQHFGSGGIFVDFFGRKAATATGPVVLARRTGATMLPCFMVRQKDNTNTIVFEPPLVSEKGKTEEEAIAIDVQRLTTMIEAYIRKYPSEWGWIHRRWKGQQI